mmetsp:Transcript_45560/g.90302  ORF Transcript_45560/g.90302 Transcript_45560/m.90302 type:complete len:302 (-) Transcript_45560:83-988(-)
MVGACPRGFAPNLKQKLVSGYSGRSKTLFAQTANSVPFCPSTPRIRHSTTRFRHKALLLRCPAAQHPESPNEDCGPPGHGAATADSLARICLRQHASSLPIRICSLSRRFSCMMTCRMTSISRDMSFSQAGRTTCCVSNPCAKGGAAPEQGSTRLLELAAPCEDAGLEIAPLRQVVSGLLGTGGVYGACCDTPPPMRASAVRPNCGTLLPLPAALLLWLPDARSLRSVPKGSRSQSRGVPFPSEDRAVPFPSEDRAVPPPVRGVAPLELPERAVWGAETLRGGTLSMSTSSDASILGPSCL